MIFIKSQALELAPQNQDGDNKIALTEKTLKKSGFRNIKQRVYYEK